MPAERRRPAVDKDSDKKGGKGEMTKAPIGLQDLRRRIYLKAKADRDWRFWGLYVHVCKEETIREAYEMARRNGGAAGIDGLTFAAIEEAGREAFLAGIRDALLEGTYRPARNRQVEIPKDGGKVRTLGIPTIRDRVVQGALKLILEPVFEADFQEGSYGYRPKRTAHQTVQRVTRAVVENKTIVIDLDLAAYFDTVRHDTLLGKVADRVSDDRILGLLKRILKAGGKQGVPQGGVMTPPTQKVTSRLSVSASLPTRLDIRHVLYILYAIWPASAMPRKPSGSISPARCCSSIRTCPTPSIASPASSPSRLAKPIATCAKPSS